MEKLIKINQITDKAGRCAKPMISFAGSGFTSSRYRTIQPEKRSSVVINMDATGRYTVSNNAWELFQYGRLLSPENISARDNRAG